MSLQLSQFRDIIVANTGIEGNRLFPVARLNFYINKATKFVQQKLNGLGYKKWESTLTVNTTVTYGPVATVSINMAGDDYAPGDQLYLIGGDNNCTLLVGTVNGGGGITSVSIINAGTGYSTGVYQTSTNSLVGESAKISVLTINNSGPLVVTTLGSISTLMTALPTDMLESPSSIILLEVSDGTNKGTTRQEYNPAQYETVCANSFIAPTVKEAAYMRLANKIYVFPATIISARIFYYAAIADMANNTDTCVIPTEFEEYVISKASNDILAALGQLKDKNQADAEVAASISDAYQKFVGVMQQKGAAMPQRDSEVVQ